MDFINIILKNPSSYFGVNYYWKKVARRRRAKNLASTLTPQENLVSAEGARKMNNYADFIFLCAEGARKFVLITQHRHARCSFLA